MFLFGLSRWHLVFPKISPLTRLSWTEPILSLLPNVLRCLFDRYRWGLYLLVPAPGHSCGSFVNSICWRCRITQKSRLEILKGCFLSMCLEKTAGKVKAKWAESGKEAAQCFCLSSSSSSIPWVSKDWGRSCYSQGFQSWKTWKNWWKSQNKKDKESVNPQNQREK